MYTYENYLGGISMRYLFQFLILSVLVVGLSSCEDVDLDGFEAGEVRGTWQLRSGGGNNVFLVISDTDFNFYEFNASLNCVKTDAFQVIRRDGTGFFQVEKGDGSPEVVFAVSVNNNQLQLRRTNDPPGVVDYYTMSDVDVSIFSECLDETDIQGKWEFTHENETTYVEISDDSISVYSESLEESCFEIIDYQIAGSNNNIYRLLDEIGVGFVAELFIEIKRTQDGLDITIEDDGGTITDNYISSSADLTALQPDCGSTFPASFEGIWEIEGVANTAVSLLHLEIKQDTLRYYTDIVDQSCIDINNHPMLARRGDVFFLTSDPNSQVIDLIYQIFFDQDVLVTRITQENAFYDERFVRSSTTLAELESNICTTDF